MADQIPYRWPTRVTELLGIRYPIIEGAFGGFGTSALAAPVSAAGALGQITAGALRTPEGLRADIRKMRTLTDQPFAVNLTVGICPRIDEMFQVVLEEKPPILFTAAYRGDQYGIKAKQAGMVWVHKASTIRHVLAAERQGADAVVLVGLEGAGFKSIEQLPTMINIPAAVRQLKVPLIAAGGIGDALGFLAALGMGAEGAYIATAFMAVKECPIGNRYKQSLVDGQPWDPQYRDRWLAQPPKAQVERVIAEGKGKALEDWLPQLERVLLKEDETPRPAAFTRTYTDDDPEEAFRVGSGSLAVGVIDGMPTAKAYIEGIIRGAAQRLAAITPPR